jgi:hypothetical protein
MRNLVLAATAAILVAAGTGPTLADTAGSSNIFEQCANIRANPEGYPATMAAYCGAVGATIRHRPHAFRAAPAIRDDGPSITLPG